MSTSVHFLSGKQIVVAGAGVAGLSFVAALRRRWPVDVPPPSILLCDRDARDVSVDREGYSLSLQGTDKQGGLQALLELGLLDQIMEHAVVGGAEDSGSFKMWTSNWREIISVRRAPAAGLPASVVRIARKELRRIMVEAVEESVDIRWGVQCLSAARIPGTDGRIRVSLRAEAPAEGEPQEVDQDCDLLVVADGASSKLRSHLRPDDHLRYAGAVQLGGTAKFEGPLPSPTDRHWGCILTGEGTFGFVSPVDEHSIVWTLSRREKEPRPPLDKTDAKQVQALLDECRLLGRSIKEPFATLVQQTDPETILCLNARDKQPFYHDEVGNTGAVLFIGDSNHAVSPFAGNGANLALKDGLDLAEMLCGSGTMEDAIRAYDKVSVPRARETLKTSHDRITIGHAKGLMYWFYRTTLGLAGLLLWMIGKS